MESFVISGGNKLYGEVSLKSGKNTVLPIIACCIMSKNEIVLKNCPKITDVFGMLNIINSIGGKAYFDGDDIIINCHDANPQSVEENLTKSIRSSVFILGPIIARFKKANICYPGGCEIGKRPIDLHIAGLRALNIDIVEENCVIKCDAKNIRGAEFNLAFPSVGATENIMMAAVLTNGTTIIHNAAKEPEIVDLENFINTMGGRVRGAGTSKIVIEGVERLKGGMYTPIPDRIVAGTILAGCAMCGGTVAIKSINHSLLDSVLDVYLQSGCRINSEKNTISIQSNGILSPINKIETKPFPNFPTDMQAQIMAMLALAKGVSVVEENLFENRFRHAMELNKMGAKISVSGKLATIEGVESLFGSEVAAMDLRGGAALVIAGLAAEGVTRISDIFHIDRGYENIEKIFTSLGGEITRINHDMSDIICK